MNRKIYIASSWKNEHAVKMLTDLLRAEGWKVLSFIENNEFNGKGGDFEDWVCSQSGKACFDFDMSGATRSDLVIYISPSGQDACVEIGAAYAAGVPILGLSAKGEGLGLMRYVVYEWFSNHVELIENIKYRFALDAHMKKKYRPAIEGIVCPECRHAKLDKNGHCKACGFKTWKDEEE